MITRDEFTRRWGSDVVRRCPPAALIGIRLPEDQKQFLREVGFPNVHRFNVKYADLSLGLPRLSTVTWWKPTDPGDPSRFLLIGAADDSTVVCIDEGAAGHVVCISSDGPAQHLLNTSIVRLAECLLAAEEISNEFDLDRMSEADLASRANKFRDAVRAIDPPALHLACDDGGFWDCIVEEMSYGIM